jgi:hypothetical protein
MCLVPAVKFPARDKHHFSTSASLLPKTAEVFDISTAPETTVCDSRQEGGPVFVFTDYYYFGNYYHLHVDLLLRLFSLLEDRGVALPPYDKPFTLMPTMQREFLKGVDWEASYFDDQRAFGLEALEAMIGKVGKLQPLHKHAQGASEELCAQDVAFGLGYVDYLAEETTLRAFTQRYTTFMRAQIGLPSMVAPTKKTVALISRHNRRRIVNEVQLVELLRAETMNEGPLKGVQVHSARV